MNTHDPEIIRSVVENVLARLGQKGGNNGTSPSPAPAAPQPALAPAPKSSGPTGRHGIFDDVDAAAQASHDSFLRLKKLGVEGRSKVIDIVKSLCIANAEPWGKFELDETKIGRLDHKIEKLQIIKFVPGVEWLYPYAMSGDGGITLEEYAPFGVIGAILPMTHSIPTLSGNIVSMVAGGNAVVFNPHPGGARSAVLAVRAYNEAIEREIGIEHLICCIEHPSLESFDEICKHPLIALMAITGGPAVVNAAMKSGKRSICAGPGNPVVVVDETAKLAKAAKQVIQGAAFDNNLLCIGEKVVFAVESVFDRFMEELSRAGAVRINAPALDRLTKAAFTYREDDGGRSHPVLNRDLIGRDPEVLARHAGVSLSPGVPVIFAPTDADDPFVQEEQMMPMLPVVKVPDFETGVREAKRAEHGYRHSSILHSMNVEHMTYMAKEMDTSIFIKNGPSVAGLGLGGEGYLSYSIATTTGEGVTTPKTFTRIRRCVMVENLRIV